MASSVKLQAEPSRNYVPTECPRCHGEGRIFYPFPGDASDHPLGGVKIKGVTCLECDGSGQEAVSAELAEGMTHPQ